MPVEVCLDTAHLFAAGYDIKSEGGLASTIGQIESTIGLEKCRYFTRMIRRFRWRARGPTRAYWKGKIGADAFARILRHPRFGSGGPEGLAGRVFVAETPIDDPGMTAERGDALGVGGIERAGAGGGEGVLHADGGAEEENYHPQKDRKKREKITQ